MAKRVSQLASALWLVGWLVPPRPIHFDVALSTGQLVLALLMWRPKQKVRTEMWEGRLVAVGTKMDIGEKFNL